jgi:hypothetical protein
MLSIGRFGLVLALAALLVMPVIAEEKTEEAAATAKPAKPAKPTKPAKARTAAQDKGPSAKALFARGDQNKDGQLSLAEFQRLWAQVKSPRAGGQQGRAQYILNQADKDKDGKVTPEEYKIAFPDAPENRFALMDRNKDGVFSPQDFSRGGARGARTRRSGLNDEQGQGRRDAAEKQVRKQKGQAKSTPAKQ